MNTKTEGFLQKETKVTKCKTSILVWRSVCRQTFVCFVSFCKSLYLFVLLADVAKGGDGAESACDLSVS